MTTVNEFYEDQDGGAAIDWVALVAAVALMGIAVIYGIFDGGVSNLTTRINDDLGNVAFADPANAPDFGGGSAGEDSFGAINTLCSGTICFSDTDGDGFADQRSDGNSTNSEPNNIPMAQLESEGYLSP